LHAELDRFVEVDERVRQDLDLKNRVEYVKSKNLEDLQRSIEKVKKSRSPERRTSPHKSPYH